MPNNAILAFFTNASIWISVFACVLAQLVKVLFEYARTKSWRTALFFSTGGMPSSHSALVSSLSTSIGIREGFGTSVFAVSAVLSLVVMYDAAGVRRAAGKQAEAINMLFSSLENQGITLDKKLKELLGHSPVEVAAGALLGVMVAIVACRLLL